MPGMTDDAPFTGETFTTAARRRGGKLTKFRIDHTVYDAETDEPTDLSVICRVDPKLDLVRFGVLFRDFTATLSSLDKTNQADVLDALGRSLPSARAGLRECLVPHDRAAYDSVAEAIDINMMSRIIGLITRDLSGLDPTLPSVSSYGPDTDGVSSTAGASPEV